MSKKTECPICFERFDNSTKAPKILSCGHTFCLECLKKDLNKTQQLKCSICRKVQEINDADQLITNRTIYDLLYEPLENEEENTEYNITLGEIEFIEVKIIMIGPPSSGKTSFIRRYIDKSFIDKYNVTVGLDFKSIKYQFGNKIINLQIWDTAGTEMFQSIAVNYYRKSFAALLVFDVCNKEYFEGLDYWVNTYREYNDYENKNIYLIGNKIDLNKREISQNDIDNFMEKNHLNKYFEASAKTGQNVDEIFNKVISDINANYKNRQKNISLNEKNCMCEVYYCQ